MMLAMGMPGPTELMLLFFIVLVLFGGKALGGLGKGLGEFVRELKKTRDDLQKEITEVTEEKKK